LDVGVQELDGDVLECCASEDAHCNSQPGAVLMPLQLLIASLAGCIVNHARLIVVLFSLAEQQSDRHSASGIAIINMPLSDKTATAPWHPLARTVADLFIFSGSSPCSAIQKNVLFDYLLCLRQHRAAVSKSYR